MTNPSMAAGQSMNIALSGGSGYFVSANGNSNIAQASVTGSTLTLSGVGVGSDSITVCASSGGCGTLSVTVTAASVSPQTSPTSESATASGASLLSVIQSMQAQLSQILAQIQTMASTLTQLASTVLGSAQTSGAGAVSGSNSYTFTQFLSLSSQGAEVTALQERLTALGFYSGPITGYFGTLTETAVERYQTAHGVQSRGYVGPDTRTALNSGK